MTEQGKRDENIFELRADETPGHISVLFEGYTGETKR